MGIHRILWPAALALALCLPAHAVPFHLLVESDDDRDAGSEVVLASFDSFQDVFDANIASQAFSDLNIGPAFSVGGLAYDGSSYHLLVERDTDADAGSEIVLASFNSLQDVYDSNIASQGFSQLNIGPNFSVGGFAYDGSDYHLLVERDTDADAGSEVVWASFDTLLDLIDSNIAAQSFTQLNIGPNFSVGGLAHDGSSFHLLVERDTDADAGSEIVLASFNSLQDLLDSNIASQGFSDLNIGPAFGVGGLTAEYAAPPTGVPSPGALVLIATGWVVFTTRKIS